jgi:thiol-disulfide isomerase/thioredoxin
MKKLFCILTLVSSFGIAPGLWSGNSAFASEPPPVSGWMEQFSFTEPRRPAPQIPFKAGDGTEVTLGDFKGRVLLVNFWATWCAPCVKELPALDELQLKLGGEGLLVLAVSQDRGGASVAGPFLKKLEVNRLGLFLDPKMKLGRAFGVRALPWTILIDRDGRAVGQLAGYAEWHSDEGIALIRHYLSEGKPEEPEQAQCECRPSPPKKISDY